MRFLLLALVLLGLASPAHADTTANQVVNGTWTNVGCPSGAVGPCWIPTGSGYDADTPITPTVQSGQTYSASNAVGPIQTLSLFRYTGQPSAILNYVALYSKGGATNSFTIYAFDALPAGSTCPDKSALALGNADLGKLIPGFPIVLTPATAQGITQSVASQALVTSVKNQDTTPTTNVYFCIVANASYTPGSASDLILKVSVSQD